MTEFRTETARQVYLRTYSRTKPDGSQEGWDETVQRVVDGNLKLVAPRYIEEGEREALLDLIGNMKVLPAGRHLKSSGVNNFALNNCWAAGWDPAKPEEHFTFTLLRLAEGGGVGSNYSERFFEDFPRSRSLFRFTSSVTRSTRTTRIWLRRVSSRPSTATLGPARMRWRTPERAGLRLSGI